MKAASHEPQRLFTAGFWAECEREAALVLGALTDAGGDQLARQAGARP